PNSLTVLVLSLISPRPPYSPLFPYTTLFRSRGLVCLLSRRAARLSILWSILLMAVLSRLRLRPSMWSRRVRCGTLLRRLRDVKRSEEHTSELQSRFDLVCRLLLENKKSQKTH